MSVHRDSIYDKEVTTRPRNVVVTGRGGMGNASPLPDKALVMPELRDHIYGREVQYRSRNVMVTGRGGVGNARKSVSSASGESNSGSGSASSASVASSQLRRAQESDRSNMNRRWSSASDDFLSVINIPRDDRSDLYTISSHSTSTNDTGDLSDIPSFISQYTFRTNSNSNPSAHSRPSTTMSSNRSRRSGQSDWIARTPRSVSDDSLPLPIPEEVEATPIKTIQAGPVTFFDPFVAGYAPKGRMETRRPSEIAPFEEPPASSSASIASTNNPRSKSPKRFRIFRKSAPRVEPIDTRPPSSYSLGFPSQYGQSTETVNINNSRSASLPDENHSPVMEVRRRNTSALASAKQVLQRIT